MPRLSLPPVVIALLLLAACNRPAAEADGSPAQVAADTPVQQAGETSPTHRFQKWAGRWTGPEGLFLNITPTTPGSYQIHIKADLDSEATEEGRDDAHGIRFTLNGEPHILHPASGDDTGLKWLAGKQDCLMIKAGAGWCRD